MKNFVRSSIHITVARAGTYVVNGITVFTVRGRVYMDGKNLGIKTISLYSSYVQSKRDLATLSFIRDGDNVLFCLDGCVRDSEETIEVDKFHSVEFAD